MRTADAALLMPKGDLVLCLDSTRVPPKPPSLRVQCPLLSIDTGARARLGAAAAPRATALAAAAAAAAARTATAARAAEYGDT